MAREFKLPRGDKRPGAGRPKASGRPSGYKPEYAKEAIKLCALGATDLELADLFEINIATLHRWKSLHPEFCDALKAGKESCDEPPPVARRHRLAIDLGCFVPADYRGAVRSGQDDDLRDVERRWPAGEALPVERNPRPHLAAEDSRTGKPVAEGRDGSYFALWRL